MVTELCHIHTFFQAPEVFCKFLSDYGWSSSMNQLLESLSL